MVKTDTQTEGRNGVGAKGNVRKGQAAMRKSTLAIVQKGQTNFEMEIETLNNKRKTCFGVPVNSKMNF